ncbi:hypothetical protein IFO70_33275 [Phormidium tenue FACHB-886]|nr:hypothetical protein [Phormidium tenue FACHB-886]
MNRNEARRLLDRYFIPRNGKGDHRLYYDAAGQFVFGLATCSRSNGKCLPRSVAKQVRELCQ